MHTSENNKRTTSCIFYVLVILLVPFLFLTGMVLAYIGVLPSKVEMHSLVIVTFIFIVFAFFVKHNANYSACHMKQTFADMEEHMHEALQRNALSIMGKTKSTLSVKDFISEYYSNIRDDNFAGVASSVFPMLGILGTFVAIAISMPDFTVADTEALDHEISILLSGIGTAFYASIYGIMLSLIWTYFEKRGLAKINKKIHDLENLYSSRVWRKSELIKNEHMLSELKDQEIVQTLKETLNMDFIKNINEQYLKDFMNIIGNSSDHFRRLTTDMQEASDRLSHTLEKIHYKENTVQAVATMQENIDRFNMIASHLQKSLDSFDGSVDYTFDKIDKELGTAIEKLTAFSNIISEQNRYILEDLARLKQQEKEER